MNYKYFKGIAKNPVELQNIKKFCNLLNNFPILEMATLERAFSSRVDYQNKQKLADQLRTDCANAWRQSERETHTLYVPKHFGTPQVHLFGENTQRFPTDMVCRLGRLISDCRLRQQLVGTAMA